MKIQKHVQIFILFISVIVLLCLYNTFMKPKKENYYNGKGQLKLEVTATEANGSVTMGNIVVDYNKTSDRGNYDITSNYSISKFITLDDVTQNSPGELQFTFISSCMNDSPVVFSRNINAMKAGTAEPYEGMMEKYGLKINSFVWNLPSVRYYYRQFPSERCLGGSLPLMRSGDGKDFHIVKNTEECKAMCNAVPECNGFNSWNGGTRCTFKSKTCKIPDYYSNSKPTTWGNWHKRYEIEE